MDDKELKPEDGAVAGPSGLGGGGGGGNGAAPGGGSSHGYQGDRGEDSRSGPIPMDQDSTSQPQSQGITSV